MTLHEPSPEKFHRKSADEASSLSRPPAGLLENNDYETATSSSGPSSLAQDSLSSASSFQSLASSVGSKSSSGICADSAPTSPEHNPKSPLDGTVSPALDSTVILPSENSYDNSYVNVDIPDLDDLIAACSNINLDKSVKEQIFKENSPDRTFESAADDTTLITHDESTLQTFKTCPGVSEIHANQLEPITPAHEEVFKVPLPVNPQKSVVPYVAADSSLLKHQNSEIDDFQSFKSALNSFSEPIDERKSPSPTPCTEIDVIEASKNNLDGNDANQTFEIFAEENDIKTSVADLDFIENIKDFNTSLLNTPDATFEEVETFNLPSNVNSEFSQKLESNVQESTDLSEKTIEKLNPTVFNKTQETEKNSVTTEKFETNVSETAEHPVEVPEKSYSTAVAETEVITSNSKLENENDKSWKEQINKSISLEAAAPREHLLNKTNTLSQSKTPNKLDSVTQEALLPSKSFSAKTPIKENINDDQVVIKSENTENEPNELNTPSQKGFISPIKKENSQETICNNKNLNNLRNFEVTSSTPLPKKEIIKSESPKTSKNKSNLFPVESNSTVQIPQPVDKKFNNPANYNDKENNLYSDETVVLNRTFEKSSFDGGVTELITKDTFEATNIVHDKSYNPLLEKEPDYEAFKPQQQSTSLQPSGNLNFEKLQEAALDVAKDIDASIEEEDADVGEHFISATTDLFEDPAAFDFLNQHGSQPEKRGDRYDSLFMKFDPLAQRLSMLPQKNNFSDSPVEVEEDKKETKIEPVNTTPKKNPALAAIDRLLFDSPSVENFNSKVVDEAKAKQKEETEKSQSPLVSLVDEKMVKELELVRSSVLQLEEELEKQKKDHERQLEKQKLEYKKELDKIKLTCDDKINQVHTKLTEEVKCKDQMTVVVEEYEKSISRLIADREKDKSSLEMEKARLQEELDLANQHLSNTEAAFSDVHSKYERLKKSVAAYRSNEAVLKESIAENQDTIKTLENRYEQLKSHATAQLEKANVELEAIRKQHEAETIKLKAMLRKAELKSKSLEETVEQKIKENKELTKIIDEMIARVN